MVSKSVANGTKTEPAPNKGGDAIQGMDGISRDPNSSGTSQSTVREKGKSSPPRGRGPSPSGSGEKEKGDNEVNRGVPTTLPNPSSSSNPFKQSDNILQAVKHSHNYSGGPKAAKTRYLAVYYEKYRTRCYDFLLRKRYNITLEQYYLMLIKQLFKCAICDYIHGDKPGRAGRLHVDHNHRTNSVRRLVCCGCNLLIGRIEKAQIDGKLNKVLAYLEKYNVEESREVTKLIEYPN